MTEIVCTATDIDATSGSASAIAMVAPCGCPRCSNARLGEQAERRGWLRVGTTSQRRRVEPHPLGPMGATLLGENTETSPAGTAR